MLELITCLFNATLTHANKRKKLSNKGNTRKREGACNISN